MTTIGLAMIARNAAAIMERALNPLIGHVDEIAIVLGGESSDNTEQVARRYSPAVRCFKGPVDEQGRLLDFGAARQQSFDALSTDWVIMVDTDDIWNGVQYLRRTVNDAEQAGKTMVLVPYQLDNSRFLQGRIIRRDSGRWFGPIHERFERLVKENLIVDRPSVSQERPEDGGERLRRGIAIAEAWLKDHPLDVRVMAHLSNDCRLVGDYEQATEWADQYFKISPNDNREEQFSVAHTAAGCYLKLGRYWSALYEAERALTIADYGIGWTMLAEAAYRLPADYQSGPLAELAIMAADKAQAKGASLTTFPVNPLNVTYAPCHIKTLALTALERYDEALAAADMALMINKNEDLLQLRLQLCNKLGVIP